MMPQGNILIIEDEIELAKIFRDYLIADDFEVSLMHTGEGAVEKINEILPDLVLLDLTLPVKDGLAICKELREFSNIPIIMVTAKVGEIDRLLGLDIGADDYICKPAKPREVVARVKTVLRRVRNTQGLKTSSRFKLDSSRQLGCWDNNTFELTPVEFRLLKLLNKNPGHIYSRDQLMGIIYEDGRYVSQRTIDTHVKNARQKLASISKIKNPIRSVYGMGYKLEIDA